jgi:hypothetical protein
MTRGIRGDHMNIQAGCCPAGETAGRWQVRAIRGDRIVGSRGCGGDRMAAAARAALPA